MTNESLLQIVKEGIKNEDITALKRLENELIENIRFEAFKKSGTKKSDISIIKRILKEASANEKYRYAHKFLYEDKIYYGFTQDHYILACDNNMQIEESKEGMILDMNRTIIPSLFDDCIEINVDMVDLKTFCKTHKRTDKPGKKAYIIEYTEGKKISVNPYYLLDALQFNDTNIIHIAGASKPIMIENKNKNTLGMVLPYRIKEI